MSRRVTLGCAAALLCLCGCASKYMKGTPLYTGEYVKREGPREDRVNLWPLAYYRKPALSVLWPLMESTDDHLAARPLFSVYKLDKERHQYNVVAPLVQFDYDTRDHRIVPFFWGKDHKGKPYFVLAPLAWLESGNKVVFPLFWWKTGFTLFPVVWHERGKRLHVLPLWCYTQDAEGHYDLNVAWPIGRLKKSKEETGFDVWPLLGRYGGGEKSRAYALWPLLQERRDKRSVTRAALPLFVHRRSERKDGGSDETLLTPLWSSGRGGRATWRALFPLYFGGRTEGMKGKPDHVWATLLPLLYHAREGDERTLLTPLWSSGKDAKGQWRMLLPLYFAGSEKGSAKRKARSWCCLVPLFYHGREGDDRTTLTPLWSAGKSGDARWRVLLPVFFQKQEKATRPAAGDKAAVDKDKGWWLLLPAAFGSHDGDDRLLLTPAFAAGETKTGSWSAALPLYYYRRNEAAGTSSLLTPLAGRLTSPEKTRWYVLPLLSSMSWAKGEQDLWFLAPLVHARWGGTRRQSHVLPLYYHDSKDNTFYSLPFSTATGPDGSFTNLFGLLAHWDRDKAGRRTSQFLLPLSELAWGTEGRLERARVSPLFSWRKKTDGASLWTLPWFHWSRDAHSHTHGLIPVWLYSRDTSKNTRSFYSLPLSWGTSLKKKFVNLFGLLAHYSRDRQGRTSVQALLPFTALSWDKDGRCDHARLLPLFNWSREATGYSFWAAPWLHARKDATSRRNGLFPLWSYSQRTWRKTGHEDRDFRVLGWLYDYRFRGGRHPKDKPEEKQDYTRARILWRAMHYERVNDDRSLDLFPFITWDRRADGTRQFTFLWRLYRSRRAPDGGRKLDILFLPILRR